MDSHHTPNKQNRSNIRSTTSQSYLKRTPESGHRPTPSSDLTILRQNQYLKNQIRQLQAKNRSISTEVEQLHYQKNFSETKFIQKMNLEGENIAQFHKQKNYQMQLLQIKHEEDLGRIKRQQEIQIDEFLRDIKHKDYQLKERDEQIRFLDLRIVEMKQEYDGLDRQLQRVREEQALTTDDLTKAEFQIKKYSMLADELENQKAEMESQIRVLLDIEAEKAHTINELQINLRHSEQNERRLTDKLAVLNQNFAELENHIALMKQKLMASEADNDSLNHRLTSTQLNLRDKERLVVEQNDRQIHLRRQLQEHQVRERKRENEVAELMAENERLYRQLNINKHRLHEIGINYGVQI